MALRFVLILVLASLSWHCQSKTLKILIWEDYLSPNIVLRWQQETGHLIKQIYFDNDEMRDQALKNAKEHSIDLAILDETAAQAMNHQGALLPLPDWELRKNTPSVFSSQCTENAAPYLWGTMGIVYRTDKVKTPPNSWLELLRPSHQLKGHISMLYDYQDLMTPALLHMGESINTENKTLLMRAFEILKKQRGSVLTFQYPISFIQDNPQSDMLYMAQAYGGDQFTMNEIAGKPGLWKYTIPKEGTSLWVDCLAALAETDAPELAKHFIHFLLQPQNAAQNSSDTEFATPDQAAFPLVAKEIRENPLIYPPAEYLKRSQFNAILSSEAVQLRERMKRALLNDQEID